MVIGQIIFDLAALAQLVDRPDDPCNVAAGMRLENETRKAQLLAPDRVEKIAKTVLKLGEPRQDQIAYEER